MTPSILTTTITAIIFIALPFFSSITAVSKTTTGHCHSNKLPHPVVILISSAGFRFGYQWKTDTPNIHRLINNGTSADYLSATGLINDAAFGAWLRSADLRHRTNTKPTITATEVDRTNNAELESKLRESKDTPSIDSMVLTSSELEEAIAAGF